MGLGPHTRACSTGSLHPSPRPPSIGHPDPRAAAPTYIANLKILAHEEVE